MKYFVDGTWYSELGRRIKLNDLLNGVKQALKEYQEFQKEERDRLTQRRKGRRGTR